MEAEIVAHRGGAGMAPENTLAAIKNAVQIGVEWIEIDVRLTKDEKLVCFHDKRVSRTTNGSGKVRKLTLAQLKTLDSGSWFGKDFSEEKIPTLEEVIQEVNGQCKLLIEIKKDKRNMEVISDLLIDLMDKYKARKWCVIQSFHPAILHRLFLKDSTLPLNQLLVYKHPYIPLQYDGVFRAGNVFKHGYLQAINLDHRFVTKKLIRKIRGKGKKIYCWTVNSEKRMLALMHMGVDGIITDYPGKLKALREKERE